MVQKSLSQLRKERDNLTKKFKDVEQRSEKKRIDTLERRKLQTEIRSLKHPRSTIAAKSFLRSARKSSLATFDFIKDRARKFDDALLRQEKRDQLKKRALSNSGKKKTNKRTKKK